MSGAGDGMPKRVVVTDLRFEGLLNERAAAERFGASFHEFDCQDAGEVADALRDADIAFVNLVTVTEDALAGMRPGALIVRYGIGVDNVDVAAARRLGIRVANVPDYGSDTVADHASAAMLALLRRLPVFDAAIRAEGWINPDRVKRDRLPAHEPTSRLQTFRIPTLHAMRWFDRPVPTLERRGSPSAPRP